jgi:ribosomal protein S18 acetylase RimI-like enzyme
VKLRDMLENDVDFAHGLAEAEEWPTIKNEFITLMNHRPGRVFICEQEGVPVGMVSAVAYGSLGFIGWLIVHQDFRGRGLGTRIMEHALKHLQTQGVEVILLDATKKAIPLYERLGFCKVMRSLRLRISGKGSDVDDTGIMDESSFERVLLLDNEHFGADRSYFLKKLHQDNADLSFVLKSQDEIVGFIMGHGEENFIWVGPWIVNPDHLSKAGNLVTRVIRAAKDKQTILIGVLEHNEDALSILNSCSQAEQFGFSWRMAYGDVEKLTNSKGELAIGYPSKG